MKLKLGMLMLTACLFLYEILDVAMPPPLLSPLMAALLGIIPRGAVPQMGKVSKLLSPSSSDAVLRV